MKLPLLFIDRSGVADQDPCHKNSQDACKCGNCRPSPFRIKNLT